MGIIDSIFGVFTEVSDWFVTAIQSVLPIFWETSADGGSLTIIGVLAVISLGISVIMMLFRTVESFLTFRG